MIRSVAARLDIALDAGLQPLSRRPHDDGRLQYRLDRRASIKDILESVGIPHTEVGGIVINGQPVDFGACPGHGDRIVVSAIFPPQDVTRPCRLRPDPLPAVRFLVDENVGKLAALLRGLGYDTLAARGITDARLAAMAHAQGRIVLTRDVALLKRRQIVFGRLVRTGIPDRQLQEVVGHFGLTGAHRVFQRCLECNTVLTSVAKADIDHRLEPRTRQYFNAFKRCPTCDRIYWHGSHCDRMVARFRGLGIRIAMEPEPPS